MSARSVLVTGGAKRVGRAIVERFAAAGWQRGRDWESKVYEGAEHEENAWAARLPEIFGWLLAR